MGTVYSVMDFPLRIGERTIGSFEVSRTGTGEFSQEANQLVSREYRKPFVVPAKV